MTKVYGTGTYDFKRHRVAEYPLELPSHPAEKPLEAKPGSNLSSSITLLTKIAEESWIKTGGKLPEKPFDPEVVKEIYVTELKGRDLTIVEKTNYLVFMINAFQSLEDAVVNEIVLSLAGFGTVCLMDVSRWSSAFNLL